uniref:Uncharacterized protein n=1 Tax=Nelumbo nucifera TaxID=4432 RepID=A0A822ZNW6_NELNU|nr:TPA_asm: hypothetical protein HUJ06_003425 [Nelumbo nucifera]
MVISFIMAGRDTTSTAVTWLFWSLCRHPNTEKDVVKEVVITLGNDEQKSLDYEPLKDLPLLKACLCESMRLYPPMAWDSKHSPPVQCSKEKAKLQKKAKSRERVKMKVIINISRYFISLS